MNRIISLLLTAVLLSTAAQSIAVTRAKSSRQIEQLKYNAYWHWGFIWKLAGSGELTLTEEVESDNTTRFHGRLCGRSHSIVETIMKVRDTLDCYYAPQNLIPLEYCKKTNEGNYHAIEHNYYHTYVGAEQCKKPHLIDRSTVDSTTVDIYRWRSNHGNNHVVVSSLGIGFDMLSIFYELRNLDFGQMKAGQQLEYYINAGVKNKALHVKFCGQQTCTLKNGRKYDAYAIELTFASKDSDSTPVLAWLATTPDHRPLSVIISLKRIGAVQGEIVE